MKFRTISQLSHSSGLSNKEIYSQLVDLGILTAEQSTTEKGKQYVQNKYIQNGNGGYWLNLFSSQILPLLQNKKK